ncbi:Permease of the drug/metabolite transporter (DMT) superfamily [Leifsonia rubra CMS 76R]|nr:Permease of the drug/metabolite transporter (DMT) superfamily [Leifsonia rubra CMS 76R]
MSTTASSRLGSLSILGAATLWGTTGTAASFFPENISPLAIGAATMVGGGILLLMLSFRAARAAFMDASARRWLVLGGAGVFVYPLAFYSSMDLAGIAVGNVVSLGTGPVFAAVLERAIDHKRLSVLWKITTPVALGGVVVLILNGGHLGPTAPGSTFTGVGLGLLAGVSYALYTYSSTRVIRARRSSGAAMGAMFGVGALLLLPILLIFGAPLMQSGATVSIAVYLIVGPMFVAYILFGIGLRTTTSSTATTITLLEPVVATLLAVIVVGGVVGPHSVGWTRAHICCGNCAQHG